VLRLRSSKIDGLDRGAVPRASTIKACYMATFKEKCRIYYLVKGDLCRVSCKQIEESYDGYLKRLWGNHERAVYGEEGFEENFKKFCALRVLL
jgi:hypothetical protein